MEEERSKLDQMVDDITTMTAKLACANVDFAGSDVINLYGLYLGQVAMSDRQAREDRMIEVQQRAIEAEMMRRTGMNIPMDSGHLDG